MFTLPYIIIIISIGISNITNIKIRYIRIPIILFTAVIFIASLSYYLNYKSNIKPNFFNDSLPKITQNSNIKTIIYPSHLIANIANSYYKKNIKTIQLINTNQQKNIIRTVNKQYKTDTVTVNECDMYWFINNPFSNEPHQ